MSNPKGQGLLGWVIIITIVALAIILLLNPSLGVAGALTVLWGKIVAGTVWLIAAFQHASLASILVAILIVLLVVWLLGRRRH